MNRKLTPDPLTGRPTVALHEAFSFDRNHALCRVETNLAAFKLPTTRGRVLIERKQFLTVDGPFAAAARAHARIEVVLPTLPR